MFNLLAKYKTISILGSVAAFVILTGVSIGTFTNQYAIPDKGRISPSPTTYISPSPTQTQEPTPTPTFITKRIVDPMIDCPFAHVGARQMRKSDCRKAFECQVGNDWLVYTSKDQCSTDQAAHSNSQQPQQQSTTQNTNTTQNSDAIRQQNYLTCVNAVETAHTNDSVECFNRFSELSMRDICFAQMTDLKVRQRQDCSNLYGN